jgi:protein involved in polysaccharide export with SLBB domain
VRRESERRAAEIERVLRETSQPQVQIEELARKLAELESLFAARGDARYALAEKVRTEPVANPNEPVRAGDLLVIEIAGEPDLPREYEVRTDGSIRLPLIGSVRVLGSTAAQVRDAVAKLITDRGLGKSPGVAVSLRRPRGE